MNSDHNIPLAMYVFRIQTLLGFISDFFIEPDLHPCTVEKVYAFLLSIVISILFDNVAVFISKHFSLKVLPKGVLLKR